MKLSAVDEGSPKGESTHRDDLGPLDRGEPHAMCA